MKKKKKKKFFFFLKDKESPTKLPAKSLLLIKKVKIEKSPK